MAVSRPALWVSAASVHAYPVGALYATVQVTYWTEATDVCIQVVDRGAGSRRRYPATVAGMACR